MTVDIEWKNGILVSGTLVVESNVRQRPVQVVYHNRILASFNTVSGMKKVIRSL